MRWWMTSMTLISLVSCQHAAPSQDDHSSVVDNTNSRTPINRLRAKREIYLTFQDQAQSTCIGMCMYNERKSYYGCEKRCKIGTPRLHDDRRAARKLRGHRARSGDSV